MKPPWHMTADEWYREFDDTRPNALGTGGDSRLGGMGAATTVRGLGARYLAAAERQKVDGTIRPHDA